MDDLLQQGIAAYQSGKRDEARRLLGTFVRQNPNNEAGWGWLFNVCDTDKERMDCLKQVIRINPLNEKTNLLLKEYTAPDQPLKQTVIKKTPDRDYKNDALARKVIRFLVIFQVSALFIGVILTLVRLSSLALFIAFVSLVLLIGALIWFYIRYQMYPTVQEKRKLTQQSKSLQAQILAHSTNINLTQQNREKIKQAEQAELLAALQDIQKKHIDAGLRLAHIADADIPGIGPALKQRLVTNGFSTAISITQNVSRVEGFGPAKSQAVLDWRAKVHSQYNATKPKELPAETKEQIIKKYTIHHENNNAEEKKAQETKTKLEKKSQEIQPRINELAPLTFGAFLRYALGSKGIVAAVTGAGLILSQILLGTSATFGAIVQSKPTATPTPTITLTQTASLTHTETQFPIDTLIPLNTFTPTGTLTLIYTFTPTKTATRTPTCTFTPRPTFTLQAPTLGSVILPTNLPTVQTCCKHCGPNSQACGDTCISLKYVCNSAPGCACQ